MPVHANLLARGPHYLFDYESHQRQRAHWSGMSRRVADANGPRSAVNGRGIQALHRLRIAATGVLGDVHHVKPERNGISDGLLRGLQKKVVRPPFSESADRARP